MRTTLRCFAAVFAICAGLVAQDVTRGKVVVSNDFVQVDEFGTAVADCAATEPTVLLRFLRDRSGHDKSSRSRDGVMYLKRGERYGCAGPPDERGYTVVLKASPPMAAFADDAVKLDPKHNEVLLENERVRVVRIHFGPGESGPMVDKRARVIIMLTDSHATVTLPDGHSEVRDGKAGTVAFSKGGRQATNNVGTTELENIVVELKGK